MLETIREVWEYRTMIQSLVHRDLRGRYKASVLGFLWTFIVPLCQLLVYTIVFSVILKSQIERFYLYLFVALIPWNFFAGCLTNGVSCIVQQQALVNKIYFPREVIPISYVTGAFVNMLYCEIIVVAVAVFSGVQFNILGLLFLPVVFFVEYILALGITMIISSVNVYFRDLEHILQIFVMAWQFLSPIVYSIEMVPESARKIFMLNPMASIIVSYRDVLYYKQAPDLSTMLLALGMGIVFLVAGWFIFKKLNRRFAEVL